MKRPILTLLLASALTLPLSVQAAGLSVGSSGSAGGSAGTSVGVGGLSAGVNSNIGASTSGSTAGSGTLGSGTATRTDLGKRQAIQSDTMARPNGPLNDPDTITSGTTTATGIDTNANASVNATSNTSTTNPDSTISGGTNSSAGVISNARTNNGTGIGLGNGTVTDGTIANGTAGSANIANGVAADASGNLRLDTARIRAVQTALKNKGYYTGTVDGRWGGATSRALQKFQIENRLRATGQADISTLNELDINSHMSGSGAASVSPAAR